MRTIDKATPDQAERLYDIMVKATEVGCAPCYPAEVIDIWHKGRSAEGMLGVIADAKIYTLVDDDIPRGFIHFDDSELIGLFVHPDDHHKGYGTALFDFAVDMIAARPIQVLATLNAETFYTCLGCEKVGTQAVRRHDHDIYVVRMELP